MKKILMVILTFLLVGCNNQVELTETISMMKSIKNYKMSVVVSSGSVTNDFDISADVANKISEIKTKTNYHSIKSVYIDESDGKLVRYSRDDTWKKSIARYSPMFNFDILSGKIFKVIEKKDLYTIYKSSYEINEIVPLIANYIDDYEVIQIIDNSVTTDVNNYISNFKLILKVQDSNNIFEIKITFSFDNYNSNGDLRISDSIKKEADGNI